MFRFVAALLALLLLTGCPSQTLTTTLDSYRGGRGDDGALYDQQFHVIAYIDGNPDRKIFDEFPAIDFRNPIDPATGDCKVGQESQIEFPGRGTHEITFKIKAPTPQSAKDNVRWALRYVITVKSTDFVAKIDLSEASCEKISDPQFDYQYVWRFKIPRQWPSAY